MKLLFVCSRNLARSPSAERLFRGRSLGRLGPFETRSVGTASSARRRIGQRDLEWADAVLVMESGHRRQIQERFGRRPEPAILVLDVPDDYEAMDTELLELLEGRVEFALTPFGV